MTQLGAIDPQSPRDLLAVVHDADGRHIDHLEAGLPDSQAEIDILWRVEDAFIEQADRAEQLAPEKPESRDGVVDRNRRPKTIEPYHLLGFDREQAEQTTQYVLDHPKPVHRLLPAPVGVLHARHDHADPRVASQIRHQQWTDARSQIGVSVHDADELTLRHAQKGVPRSGRPGIRASIKWLDPGIRSSGLL